MRRLALYLSAVVLLVLSVLVALAKVSPLPGVYALRFLFDWGAVQANAGLAPVLPPDRIEFLDLAYGPDPRERLDLFLPPGPPPPEGWPVLLWVHGGAFVAGQKEDVGNYLRLIAPAGFATVAPNYTRAPGARHPGPTAQMLEALLWIKAAARDRPLDASRIVLAGDSAGSHIALQTAIALHDPAYARDLGLRPLTEAGAIRGLALFCGIYDLPKAPGTGPVGFLLDTAAWAYLGARDPTEAPAASGFALLSRLPATLPPLFITAGNADPLLDQSQALADAALGLGLTIETLFFPPDHQPPLGHEYQFTLDAAGEEARARLLKFLATVAAQAD